MKLLKQILYLVAGVMGLSALIISAQISSAQPGLPPNVPAVQELHVINPSSEAELYGLIYRPAGSSPEERYPVLVLIPGGSSAGTSSYSAPVAQRYADLGFLVVVFDPDGRGESTGTENDNGHVHQDGLAAVVESAASHPQSDGDVVLLSQSYGVTMASGALARHADLPVVFYVDWEGPANRDDTGGCDGSGLGHLQDHDCDDEAFWSEREASTFISQIEVPYQRVQSARDHVQPDNEHALLMINNATSTQYGGSGRSPWTRLNNELHNKTYDSDAGIEWAAEGTSVQALLIAHLEAFLEGQIP